MQNLDFSPRVQRPNYAAATVEEHDEVVPDRPTDIKKMNRNYILVISLLLFAFTGGLVAGMKLGKMSVADASVITNSDDNNPDFNPDAPVATENVATEFANTGLEGRFLIKVGTMDASDAEAMTVRLNQNAELEKIRPSRCKFVQETGDRQYLAFRMPVQNNNELQNVFLGCFLSEQKQSEVLRLLNQQSIPGTTNARAFEFTSN